MGDAPTDAVVEQFVGGLKDDLTNLITTLNAQHLERIRTLESELSSSKAVNDYFQDRIESLRAEKDKSSVCVTKEKDGLPNGNTAFQMPGSDLRVVCLIDGNETMFALSQIAKGTAGGRFVAATLAESIRGYLSSTQYPLRAWVFFNKRELLDNLRTQGNEDAWKGVEDFILGFNQALDRSLMVDIGPGKAALAAKVKAYLGDEVKSPQTHRVFFAGYHNNDYLELVDNLVSAGYREKLVLLSGNRAMSPGFNDLKLPTLQMPALFDIVGPITGNGGSPVSPAIPTSPPGLSRQGWRPNTVGAQSGPYKAGEVTWRRASPTTAGWAMTNPMSPSHSSTSSRKQIDPKKPMSKQNPPPCNMFYLTSRCKYGDSCNFCHDYVMNSEQIENLRESVKRTPCATVNKGDTCQFDEECCYGHLCPHGQNCRYYNQGICKFVGDGMHAD